MLATELPTRPTVTSANLLPSKYVCATPFTACEKVAENMSVCRWSDEGR